MTRKKYNYKEFCDYDCFHCRFNDCINPYPKKVPIPNEYGRFYGEYNKKKAATAGKQIAAKTYNIHINYNI